MSQLFPRSQYRINPQAGHLGIVRSATFDAALVLDAIDEAHAVLDKFVEFDVDVFAILGMRNLSAFIGELVAAAMIKAAGGRFRKNPHQDGYPDLLLMDATGAAAWEALADRRRDKQPFSPFPTGGIEVKATCGSVPTPAQLARRGLTKPGIGDPRVDMLCGYDWKAHHRDTNHLLAVFWDFIDGVPRIVATFYRNDLTVADWGAIVQPREGGGRTTSVSIMTRAGIAKLFAGWITMLDDPRYIGFFEKRNGVTLP